MAGAYKIALRAEPQAVHVEDPITLVIRITGDGPPEHQPKRALLRLFPARMQDDFIIQPLPEKDRRLPGENAWEFAYRLQPKHERVTAIPGLKLVYYRPAFGKYVTTYASGIDIKVTPRPQVLPPPEVVAPVTAPPSFYELAPMGQAGDRRLDGLIVAAVLLLTPPLLAIGWRRWKHGNGVRVEQQKRSQAARHALRELDAVNDLETVVAVVNAYLRQRLNVPMAEPAPSELERILARGGVSKALRRRVVEFARACDALRFAGNASPNGTPSREAMQLIQALEAEPCLR